MDGLLLHDVDFEILRSIPTFTPGGVFIVSTADRKILYVGANMLSMLGYTEESFRTIIGDDFINLVSPEDRERVLISIAGQEKRSNSVRIVYRIRRGDDSLMWVVAESRSHTLKNGVTIAYVAILDITGSDIIRIANVENGVDLNYILESIMAGIVVYRFEEDGIHLVLEEANEPAARMVGIHRRDLVGLDTDLLYQMIYPQDHEMTRAFFANLCTGNGHQDNITYRLIYRGEPKYYLCQCSSHRLPDGSYRVFCVYTDTSRQKAQEAEFNVILHNFLFANPDSQNTFRLNLTRNVCGECYGTAAASRERFGFYSADETLQALGEVMGNPETKAYYLEHFTVEKLLEMHKEAQYPSIEYKRCVPGEPKHWVRTYFYPLQNPATEDVEAIGYTVDIDHLHKEEQIISIIADREYDSYGVIETDTGHVEYFGSKTEMAGGIDENTIIHSDDGVKAVMAHMASDEEREEIWKNLNFSTILERVARTGMYSYSYSFGGMRKQITYHYLDDDKEELVFASKDITETFKLEEENASILRNALHNEKKANSQKTSFFGNASHDLRTPLNAILGYDGLALEKDNVPEDVRNYLEKIRAAGTNMLNLVNDMLDLQRIESGQMTLKPTITNINILIEEILASVQAQAEARDIALIIDTKRAYKGTVWADHIRTRQMYVNLLSNAIKFTPEGGTVTFTIICEDQTDKDILCKILVQDTGVGMSEDFVKNKLFEPFAQERTKATSHIGGTGLGMSIVKRTMEQLGGTIDVQSETGKGTTFILHLRFDKANDIHGDEEVKTGPNVLRSIAGMHLLLCEDNEMNMEIATEVLTMAGATVDTAGDGKEGSTTLINSDEGTYDAILMDIRMPVMNGYEAAKAIRASGHPQARTIPIIALTADAFDSDIKQAKDAGMNGHLSKPLNVEELIQTLAGYQAHHQ